VPANLRRVLEEHSQLEECKIKQRQPKVQAAMAGGQLAPARWEVALAVPSASTPHLDTNGLLHPASRVADQADAQLADVQRAALQ